DNKLVKSLIENAKAGMNSAFEQLFKIGRGRVYAVCFRILANKDEAEKMAVKVFFISWQQIKFMRSSITFSAWLTGITVYTVLELLREKKTEIEDTHAAAEQFPALSPLELAILSLPQDERTVVVLHDVENYTFVETSDILGLPPAQIRELLNKAHKKLIREIGL
ncbi:MAG: RNA polymerase sigma factor, partial [Ignavibacteriaceae bacterium]|nr:RNA polymerase sigma factor [Ignavibacteriaceae bacterium]